MPQALQNQPATLPYKKMADAIRVLAMDAVEQAKSGHPGMPMGMADVATVLWADFLKHAPQHPGWPDRDRFVLSAGHGSMLLYSLLYLTGYNDISMDEIKRFRQFGAKTAGHPEYGHAAGIETTTGPLGQGLGNAVGMALAEKILAERFGEVVNHYTYVIAGDGDLMEGISHEAISLAGHLKLSKLIVLFDDNAITIDGPTSLCVSDDQIRRFEASGWDAVRIDGHDHDAIRNAIARAQKSDKPSLIACKTTIAYGAPTKAGSSASHGAPLGASEIEGARKALGWSHAPFEIPDDTLRGWRETARRGEEDYRSWEQRREELDDERGTAFDAMLSGSLPEGWREALATYKKEQTANPEPVATRKSSGMTLEVLCRHIPALIGGSADLTGSNNTLTKFNDPIKPDECGGSYLYYGVREHAMGAVMNGLALHGGFIPYGGTFLVFSDYMRPAIRLSALMGLRVIYIMTHDSIGVGEDGPTHQPVEHLASLRAIPGLWVFRPADTVETAECWQLALERKDGPSLFALTRQNLTPARRKPVAENLSAKGGYTLAGEQDAAVTLIATGSEVMLALEARDILTGEGISARVVSLPCTALFDAQSAAYRREVLGDAPRIAIEAASSYGWDRYLREGDRFIGMEGFGASAPAPELYEHFGITARKVAEAAKACVAG